MAEISDASDEFMDFMFVGLDHGISSIEEGSGPLIPFVITRTGEEKKLQRFVTEYYEEGVKEAERFVGETTPKPDWAIVVFDGYTTINEERSDAIYVKAYDKTLNEAFVFVQRYSPKTVTTEFSLTGNPALIGKEANILLG